ncbi:unnamed protein product [Laminaria digitata]
MYPCRVDLSSALFRFRPCEVALWPAHDCLFWLAFLRLQPLSALLFSTLLRRASLVTNFDARAQHDRCPPVEGYSLVACSSLLCTRLFKKKKHTQKKTSAVSFPDRSILNFTICVSHLL